MIQNSQVEIRIEKLTDCSDELRKKRVIHSLFSNKISGFPILLMQFLMKNFKKRKKDQLFEFSNQLNSFCTRTNRSNTQPLSVTIQFGRVLSKKKKT